MKNTKYIVLFAVTVILAISCEDLKLGDAGLSKAPEAQGATLDTLFASKSNADMVLSTAYAYLPYGIPTSSDTKLGNNVIESLTDFQYSYRGNESDGPRNLYYNGALSSTISSSSIGTEAYRFGSESDYYAIRFAWTVIENVDRIPDATEVEKDQMAAEAKMCLAIAYSNMLRYVGGVPIIDHAVVVGEKYSYPRATFKETVDFIIDLLDECAEDLPWVQTGVNDGRMTRAGALALKLRVQCFAASPTFNSDTPYRENAYPYNCYGNYDEERWNDAKKTAVQLMDELKLKGGYALVQATEATPRAYRLAYRKGYYERGTGETLISIRKGGAVSIHQDFLDQRLYSGPTLEWVNMFPWADGTDFPADFDWTDPDRNPFFDVALDGSLVETRDPRLYENIAVPGETYYNGTVAPVHTNSTSYRNNGTGFMGMKFVLQESADRSGLAPHWPLLRLSEVYLNAAEAINEADGVPSDAAYEYVNAVRARVGLPALASGMNKARFRDALLHERCLEFGYEEVRWFDIIRWGLDDALTQKLHGLYSTGDNTIKPTVFTFSTYALPDRYWETNWDKKWYFAPIPRAEVDMKYGMTQNPGW